jgi:multidrug efflux pump subunit AcrA (membrane-fusion protein)
MGSIQQKRVAWQSHKVAAVAGAILTFSLGCGQKPQDETAESATPTSLATAQVIEISPQVRKNLQIVAKPTPLTNYWRALELPGVIVDRPGVSDRGVVAPIIGVVTKIHAFPGNSVLPGAPLFSIRLVSESLHAAQLELFKATKEIEIAQRQYDRLAPLAESGAVPRARIIEIENQIERLNVMVEASRQDLQARGLPADRIEAAARGEFATEIIVQAPPGVRADQPTDAANEATTDDPKTRPFNFEVQSLHVELGQQVEAGQLLCFLADHRLLQIEGRAFKDDIPWLQQAARNGWPVEVEIADSDAGKWSAKSLQLPIDYLANVVDPESRTFSFFMALENEWQVFPQDDKLRVLWRYQPGTRVRLRVPVERLTEVFVLPRQAVVREAGESFVFTKRLDHFERQSVRVLLEDRNSVVLAQQDGLRPGGYLVHQGAAALNRLLKAQQMGDQPQHDHHGHSH